MPRVRATFQAFIDQHLAPPARSAMLAQAARQMLSDLQRQGAVGESYVRIVDGVRDAPESAVRGTGGGEIRYLFTYIGDAAAWAVEFLRARSPVGRIARRGKVPYRDSFIVGINGRFVDARSLNPRSVPPDAEIIITNTQPYNRKVDVQLVGTKRLSFSVPPGIYNDCVRAVKRQFPVIAPYRVYTVKFTGQYILRTGPKRGRLVESPAIVFGPRE